VAFCDGCGARVEWHLTKAGRRILMDADEVPDGKFVFGSGLKVEVATRDTPPQRRRFNCHWDSSPKCKPVGERMRATCYRCGSEDHLVAECPEDDERRQLGDELPSGDED
jgi:hypothetical protein